MISNTFEVTINFLWNGCVNFKRSYLFLKRKHRTLIAFWLYGNHVIFLTKNTLNTFNHYIEKIFWFFFLLVMWKKKSIKCILRNCILQPLKFISLIVFLRNDELWSQKSIGKISCNVIGYVGWIPDFRRSRRVEWDGTGRVRRMGCDGTENISFYRYRDKLGRPDENTNIHFLKHSDAFFG